MVNKSTMSCKRHLSTLNILNFRRVQQENSKNYKKNHEILQDFVLKNS